MRRRFFLGPRFRELQRKKLLLPRAVEKFFANISLVAFN
jgi:hypothetical protein